MFQTIDPPRLPPPMPKVESRPLVATVAGAAAGDKSRSGEQRLTGGETPARDRRATLKVAPHPDPDPPTGPPPTFDVTPLEHLREQAVIVAPAEDNDRAKGDNWTDGREAPAQSDENRSLKLAEKQESHQHVDMKV